MCIGISNWALFLHTPLSFSERGRLTPANISFLSPPPPLPPPPPPSWVTSACQEVPFQPPPLSPLFLPSLLFLLLQRLSPLSSPPSWELKSVVGHETGGEEEEEKEKKTIFFSGDVWGAHFFFCCKEAKKLHLLHYEMCSSSPLLFPNKENNQQKGGRAFLLSIPKGFVPPSSFLLSSSNQIRKQESALSSFLS